MGNPRVCKSDEETDVRFISRDNRDLGRGSWMVEGLYIIDDFYNNPDEVRENALKLDFSVGGNYPGLRTKPEPIEQREYIKSWFEQIMNKQITHFDGGYNTAFQFTKEEDNTWIHHDDTTWAGVLYLTPNPPIESGTALYRHKETGISMWDGVKDSDSDFNYSEEDTTDQSKWDRLVTIGNVYNRLILYRGFYYHRSDLPGFGKDKYDGRLFQPFFFDSVS